ncbi:PspA/IM30 family protein [Spirochaeta lutea]|nr:hypothetical protein [Spirochaeta lutea]
METEDTNPFEGLTLEELRDQLAQYLLTEKNLNRSITQCITDYETWKNRLNLAREQGQEELVQNAQEELGHFAQRLGALKAESDSLTGEIQRVKSQISQAFSRRKNRPSGTDPNQLLQALQSMAGKSADETALERTLKDQEADSELAALKQRLAQGKAGQPNSPNSQDAPNSPDLQDAPNSPDLQDAPNSPNSQDAPNSPDLQDAPNTQNSPDSPDSPDLQDSQDQD